MKKFLFLMLSLAVAVSASAGVKTLSGIKPASKVDFTRTAVQKKVAKFDATKTKVMNLEARKANTLAPSSFIPKFMAPVRADENIPEGYAAITLEAHQVWNTDPDNPDYSGYQMLLDADATAYGTEYTSYEDEENFSGTFSGNYANFEYKIPENADNDLNTQNIVYDGSVTIYVPAGTYDYVMLNPTPGDRIWIASNYGTASGRGNDVTYEAGLTYHYVITLGANGNDCTDVYVLAPGEALTVPENLSVNPTSTTAAVTWTDNDDLAWNLRWRPYAEGTLYDFNLNDYEEQAAEWSVYDKDGDGNNWGLGYSSSNYDDACWISKSWDSSAGDLTPDNWLFSPDITFTENTILEFTMWGPSDSWPDNMMVYVYVYGETEEEDAMYALAEEDLLTSATHETYVCEMGDLAGQTGYFCFRHYNCEGMYYLYLDDIYMGDAPSEWTYVDDPSLTTTNYTIEGLTPETHYEVQVQAAGANDNSNWSESVDFWTLAATPEVYILGEVNAQDWAANAGTLMNLDEETGLYTLDVNFDGRHEGYNYFGFTNKLGADADDWDNMASYRFGAVSDGDFYVEDEYIGQELSLTRDNGQAFRIPGGDYTLTVNLETMKLIIEKKGVEPQILIGDVNCDGDVNIADVTTLIDYLLGNDVEPFSEDNADVEPDGTISIADVTALIDKLLAGN